MKSKAKNEYDDVMEYERQILTLGNGSNQIHNYHVVSLIKEKFEQLNKDMRAQKYHNTNLAIKIRNKIYCDD